MPSFNMPSLSEFKHINIWFEDEEYRIKLYITIFFFRGKVYDINYKIVPVMDII